MWLPFRRKPPLIEVDGNDYVRALEAVVKAAIDWHDAAMRGWPSEVVTAHDRAFVAVDVFTHKWPKDYRRLRRQP